MKSYGFLNTRIIPPHPISGLKHWWIGLPNLTGGKFFYDIIGNSNGTNSNISFGNNDRIAGLQTPLFRTSSNSNISCSYKSTMKSITQITYSFWLKINTYPPTGHYYIFSDKGPINNTDDTFITIGLAGAALGYNNNLFYYSYIDSSSPNAPNGNSQSQTFLTSFTPEIGKWYNIALSGNGNFVAMYANGVLIGSQTFTYSLFNTRNYNLYFGSYGAIPPTSTYQNLNGYMDDIRIYDKALTSNEIMFVYQDGLQNNINTLNYSKMFYYNSSIIATSNFYSIFGGGGF